MSDTEQPLIYHIFADVGVESEPLSAFGVLSLAGPDVQDLYYKFNS